MNAIGDSQLLKRINLSLLLRLVRQYPDSSRSRLAALSGLTKSTVSTLVRELLETHWLSETTTAVTGQVMGRPSTPLHINTDKRTLMGVEVGVENLRAVCVNLNGVLLASAEQDVEDRQPEAIARQAAKLVRKRCRQLEARAMLLSGVGVCVPGAVDGAAGMVRLAPNMGWRNVPFLALLRAEFDKLGIAQGMAPGFTQLKNEADAAAMGEYEFGDTDGDALIFVNCDVGVGAGIVLNDGLFAGARGAAGEVGHTVLQIDGPVCSCGRRGCAEAFIGARALRKKQGAAQAGLYLGVLLHNLDALFNPHVLVVGGRSCMDNPALVDAAIAVHQDYARKAGVPAAAVRSARYGVQAAAVGAAAVVLHNYLRPLRKEIDYVSGN